MCPMILAENLVRHTPVKAELFLKQQNQQHRQ
jgi:hypothetical protein